MYLQKLYGRVRLNRAALLFSCLAVPACSDANGVSPPSELSDGSSPEPDEDGGQSDVDSGEIPSDDGDAGEDSGPPPVTPDPPDSGGVDCTQLDCDDGDVCTLDSCTAEAGCVHTPRAGAFDLGVEELELVSVDGSEPDALLAATQEDVDISQCVTWGYTGSFATLDGSRLVAAPSHGARGTLSATLGDTTISIPVFLRVQFVANSGGLSEEQRSEFEGEASESDSLSLLYPYNGTVFPLDAKPPAIQWKGGVAQDTYRIRIRSRLFELTDHITAAPPSSYAVSAEMWKTLGASGLGKEDPVSVEILRNGSEGLTVAQRRTWRIAQGHLNATVHYRELNGTCAGYHANGRSLALAVGADSAEEVVSQSQCNGCHAVSRDGTQMASSFDIASPFPFKTWDLRTFEEDTPLTVSTSLASSVKGTFAAYNPGGDKLLFSTDGSNGNTTLSIYAFASQEVVASNVLGAKCSEPAWSPDGRLVAGICNLVGGGWAFDMSSGDLVIGDVAETEDSVADARVLVAKGSETGRPSYPDFSSDSRYVVYSRTTTGSRSTGQGRIWLAATDGSFEKALPALSSHQHEFYPRFAPRRAGGYYWVAFTSRRDYGHSAFDAQGRRHVWIAAIDDSPGEKEDPSHPAFYLDGQLACASAYELQFARSICLPEGDECALGSDCCSGTCLAESPDAPRLCANQPEGACVTRENRCAEGDTCCGNLACVDGMCQQVD